jgi:predicted Holliday junction resolvase-like endonuclease
MAAKKQQLSQKPAAVKLRTMRRNRTHEEKLKERIRAQRQSAIRKAKNVIGRSAWTLLSTPHKDAVWTAIENEIRET